MSGKTCWPTWVHLLEIWRFVCNCGYFIFLRCCGKAQLSEVRTQIAKELAEQKVIEARDRILAMASESEVANQRVKDVSASMNTNYQDFVERLTQIKQQDNIVLKNDLSKLFVTQTGTNFDGQKLVLDYEPIPYSIKIYSPQILVPCLLMENWGYLNGKSFIFTNEGVDMSQTPLGTEPLE